MEDLKFRHVSLAPRVTVSNRTHVLTNLKGERSLSDIVNAAFVIRCLRCELSWNCKTENLDVERTAKHHLANVLSPPCIHMKENAGHELVVDRSSLFRFRTKRDLRLSPV